MASLGQELKRERELRGISLKEISISTKINMRFLQALEEDRLNILPGKFFIKAIIRAYAKSIGLEEDLVLNKYYEDSLQQEQSLESKHKKRKTRPLIAKNIKKFINLSVVIILLLLFLFFLYFFLQKKETSPPPADSEASTLFQEEKPVSPSVIEPLAESLPVEEKLTLEISFLEKTWLQVYADGVLKVDGIKQPGEKVMIKAHEELLIHLGNAGGISYTLKNKKGKRLGPSGAVVKNLRITIENYQKFLAQEKEIISEEAFLFQ